MINTALLIKQLDIARVFSIACSMIQTASWAEELISLKAFHCMIQKIINCHTPVFVHFILGMIGFGGLFSNCVLANCFYSFVNFSEITINIEKD